MPLQEVTGHFEEWTKTFNGIPFSLKLTFKRSHQQVMLPISPKLIDEGLCVVKEDKLHFIARSASYEVGLSGQEGRFTVSEAIATPYAGASCMELSLLGAVSSGLKLLEHVAPKLSVTYLKKINSSGPKPPPSQITRANSAEQLRTMGATPLTTEQKERGAKGEKLIADLLEERKRTTPGLRIDSLNKDERTGVGHDFEVYLNGKLIEVIEVKATTGPVGSNLKISGTQFEHALKYHDAVNVASYYLYCLFNVESVPELVVIEDPIEHIVKGGLFVMSDILLGS
jgi:hypothetical protein